MYMNKNDRKLIRLENEIQPLINKVVYYNGQLYKILHYSNIYVYVNEYLNDDELTIDNTILFMTFENYMKYRHFQTTLIKLKKPIKLKISSFYGYTEVNEEDIDNIYFIDNEKHNNYNDSYFKNNKPMVKFKHAIKNLVYMMFYGPMSNKTEEYYLKFRISNLKKHFSFFGGIDNSKKDMIDKLTEETPSYKINFYDSYLILYEEYKNI